jgi:8-oxo-dGTP pyrophosphatase MutT (NUDIX family)
VPVLILLDPNGRVLLFKFEDPRVSEANALHDDLRRRVFWCTPGGGVEEAETFEEAGRRELSAETGLLSPLPLDLWPAVAGSRSWARSGPPAESTSGCARRRRPHAPRQWPS